MKYLLFIIIVVVAGCSGAIHAENDLFSGPHSNSDRFFTHGTKFSYFPQQETNDIKETYSIGQNIFTPSVKYKPATEPATKAILENDRPYAGWLYGEYRKSFYAQDNVRDTFGIQLGCSGPCSGARQTQQQFHRIISQHVPLWDPNYTLRQEWGAILEAEREYILQEWQYADISTYGAARAGNIIDSGAFGVDLRVGYNLDKFSTEPIIFKIPSTPRSPWTAYLFTRGEQRLVLYNHFLEGSMLHSEPHTVTTEPSVQEFDAGFTIGYENFRLTYRYTIFSNEWKERPGSFTFGGFDIKW